MVAGLTTYTQKTMLKTATLQVILELRLQNWKAWEYQQGTR